MFNVPVEPIRALNPSQLSKRMALLRDGSIRRDPRWSRTARGVTALTRMSLAHVKLNRTHLRQLPRERSNMTGWGQTPSTNHTLLVGPPSTHQWPARLYARAAIQLSSRTHPVQATQDSPFVARLPVDPERIPGQKKRTVASPINGHYSLMGDFNRRPRATALDTMT